MNKLIIAMLAAVCASSYALRVAAYNTSLYRAGQGALAAELEAGSAQAQRVARVINEINPDIILLSEFDYDKSGRAATLFIKDYLKWPQAFSFAAPSNTGVDSGLDLNSNGKTGEPADCFGFGKFPGQYGMLIVSKYPINNDAVRTFRKLLWKDMPRAIYPDTLSEEALGVFRLSSKNHVDVPVDVDGKTIHILASHPTPPVFDGPEDLNGRRNHDEIRFWLDYITPAPESYITDDAGKQGALEKDALFVIAGDLNCDPRDGDGRNEIMSRLLASPCINSGMTPASKGGLRDSLESFEKNKAHKGNPAHDTGSFGSPGNLRLDYVLPGANCTVSNAQVFWPEPEDELYETVRKASDHRAVYVDIEL